MNFFWIEWITSVLEASTRCTSRFLSSFCVFLLTMVDTSVADLATPITSKKRKHEMKIHKKMCRDLWKVQLKIRNEEFVKYQFSDVISEKNTVKPD